MPVLMDMYRRNEEGEIEKVTTVAVNVIEAIENHPGEWFLGRADAERSSVPSRIKIVPIGGGK